MRKFNRISVSSYTESFYNFFASTGINRNWLSRTKDGEIETSYIGNWRLLLFILLRVNVYHKIFYLLLLFNGYFVEEEELDYFTKLGIVIWLVTTSVAVYSDYFYMSKYPLFEVLCSFWNIQSDIFQRLSIERREEFRKRLDSGARFRTTFHMVMSSIAMFGLGVQYVMDPKGILFTGYLVSNEPFAVTILLGFIEEFFLYATWAQAVSVILVIVLVYRELWVVFNVLTQEINDISKGQHNWQNVLLPSRNQKSRIGDTAELEITDYLSLPQTDPVMARDSSQFTIDLIFMEYRKLQIITDRMREILSPIMLSTIIIYFAQISSDVFVGIRLLRLEAYMEVGFYCADCCCGMLYWYISLNSLSKLDIAHEEFHAALKSFLRFDNKRRLYFRKRYRSLRKIAVYIGPSEVSRLTVCTCMMTLVNYYILAAMW